MFVCKGSSTVYQRSLFRQKKKSVLGFSVGKKKRGKTLKSLQENCVVFSKMLRKTYRPIPLHRLYTRRLFKSLKHQMLTLISLISLLQTAVFKVIFT